MQADYLSMLLPGGVVVRALISGLLLPAFLCILGHWPLQVAKPGPQFQIAAAITIALFLLSCLSARFVWEDFVAGSMILATAVLLWLAFWMVLVWGLTITLLTALHEAHGPLSKDEWLQSYTKGAGASYLSANRFEVLLTFGMASVLDRKLRITPLGKTTAFLARLARRIFGLS